MGDTLRHRGPDDEGEMIGEDGDLCVGFGHQRLSIIDLSPAGRQPMSNEDGSIWITYNGEIYNFIALREELEQKGHRFKSSSDTEVVIHLYEELGIRCLEKLNGMFAFALWDRHKKTLILARDRIGKKPLHYALSNEGIVFASELKALAYSPQCFPGNRPDVIESISHVRIRPRARYHLQVDKKTRTWPLLAIPAGSHRDGPVLGYTPNR